MPRGAPSGIATEGLEPDTAGGPGLELFVGGAAPLGIAPLEAADTAGGPGLELFVPPLGIAPL